MLLSEDEKKRLAEPTSETLYVPFVVFKFDDGTHHIIGPQACEHEKMEDAIACGEMTAQVAKATVLPLIRALTRRKAVKCVCYIVKDVVTLHREFIDECEVSCD